jgi:hypothetical protein
VTFPPQAGYSNQLNYRTVLFQGVQK